MNDYDYNEMNVDKVQGPVDVTQTEEAKQEENTEWKDQTATPEAVENVSLTLLSGEEINELQTRWNSIQAEFVDEPHTSVEQADALVIATLERISQELSNKRTILNEQWINHADISTEDLRVALMSYRSFFNRLLAL
jgi:hypothetical protein